MATKKLVGIKTVKKEPSGKAKVLTRQSGLDNGVDTEKRKEDILEMQAPLIREISVYIESKATSRITFAEDISDRYDYLFDHGYPGVSFIKLMDRYDVQKGKSKQVPKKKTADGLPKKYSYLVSILSGFRHAPKSDPVILKIIAWILGVPTIQIYIWSGLFEVEDLVRTDDLDKRIAVAYESMSCDPTYAMLCPSATEWAGATQALKLRFIMAYEYAAGQRLLESASLELSEEEMSELQDVIRPIPLKKTSSKKR